MAGTVGPLETRPKTNVDNVFDLAFLDASPWISGERAFVIANQETYQLRRESIAVIDGFNVVAVGPNSTGQGRWIRECFICGFVCNTAYAAISDTPLLSPQTYTPILSTTITTTTGNALFIAASINGIIGADSDSAFVSFAVAVDGDAIPTANQSFSHSQSFIVPGTNTYGLYNSITFRKFVLPGFHTITIYALTSDPGTSFQIRPNAVPGFDHGTLYVDEVCFPAIT